MGSTRLSSEQRLDQHLEVFYGNNKAFTAKAKDWQIYHVINCVNYQQALAIEKHIKRMRSKIYLENLKKFPEIANKLKAKYYPESLPR